jgi:hypothetical protein
MKSLLKINKMMDISKPMQSTVTPHLLLMACEGNQQLDEETKRNSNGKYVVTKK